MYAYKNKRIIRKTMEMDYEKLKKVRKLLGAESDTEAVDKALEVVLANKEIELALDSVFGKLPNFLVT